MVVLSLSENFDDTVLQEEQACGVVPGTLKYISFLEHFDLEVVNNVMQGVIPDIFEVLNPLNTFLCKSLHPVIVVENSLLELFLKLWEFDKHLFVLWFLKHCQR